MYNNASNATNAINTIYPGALDTRTCQRWIKKFKNGDFNFLDGIESDKLVCSHFKITVYKKEMESLSERWAKITNNDANYIID